nr:hypothetical protein [Rhodoferax sp.]
MGCSAAGGAIERLQHPARQQAVGTRFGGEGTFGKAYGKRILLSRLSIRNSIGSTWMPKE